MDTEAIFPIFPLTGVILLPGQELPLNIFEPRYLAMIDYALKHDGLIGMIQPKPPYDESQDGTGPVFTVGTAGRIAEHRETEDGRIELILDAHQRFSVDEELPIQDGFRLVRASFDGFDNINSLKSEEQLEATEIAFKLKRFLDAMAVKINWQEAEQMSGNTLLDLLAMMLPFPPEDKQALLEAKTHPQRLDVMAALATMYAKSDFVANGPLH